ncbi:MAG: polyprenol monophosphomannose synthase [Acidobacteria bacterium]|nr:polyprenol monophosphomannose synthase [Acidobacteriota bacterium]
MNHRPQLSIIVPTYNERERLGELVRTTADVFRTEGIGGEIVIVDDNSPDGTGRVAAELAKQFHVKVVHRAGKLGLGSAVIDGFRVARGDVLGVMDADLSHPPAVLPRMLEALTRHGADFVIGSRYIPGGSTEGWSITRRLMSRLACLIARPLTPVRDATSGFFVLRPEVVHEIEISAAGFKICLELLVRGRARSVVELPYRFTDRLVGESKMTVREALGYVVQLCDLLLYRLRNRGTASRPVYKRLTAFGM